MRCIKRSRFFFLFCFCVFLFLCLYCFISYHFIRFMMANISVLCFVICCLHAVPRSCWNRPDTKDCYSTWKQSKESFQQRLAMWVSPLTVEPYCCELILTVYVRSTGGALELNHLFSHIRWLVSCEANYIRSWWNFRLYQCQLHAGRCYIKIKFSEDLFITTPYREHINITFVWFHELSFFLSITSRRHTS